MYRTRRIELFRYGIFPLTAISFVWIHRHQFFSHSARWWIDEKNTGECAHRVHIYWRGIVSEFPWSEEAGNIQSMLEQDNFLPLWHFEQQGIFRFLHGHRPDSQLLLHLQALIVRNFVYVWDAWMMEICGRFVVSMSLNSADVVRVKSIKSVEVNALEMIPSRVAR